MPRPSDRPSGAVWRLLDEWRQAHPLNPNQRQLAGLLEVSDSLLSSWKLCQSVIQREDVDLIAERTGIKKALVQAAADEDLPAALEFVQARRGESKGRKRRRG